MKLLLEFHLSSKGLEMKQVATTHLVVLALLHTSAVFAQSTIRFQNHYIGESASDFLKDEPGVAKRLAECHDIQANQDEWVKKEHPELSAAAPYDPDEATQKWHRKQFDEVVANLSSARGCSELFKAVESNGRASFLRADLLARPTPATFTGWVFDSGHLTTIQMDFE